MPAPETVTEAVAFLAREGYRDDLRDLGPKGGAVEFGSSQGDDGLVGRGGAGVAERLEVPLELVRVHLVLRTSEGLHEVATHDLAHPPRTGPFPPVPAVHGRPAGRAVHLHCWASGRLSGPSGEGGI